MLAMYVPWVNGSISLAGVRMSHRRSLPSFGRVVNGRPSLLPCLYTYMTTLWVIRRFEGRWCGCCVSTYLTFSSSFFLSFLCCSFQLTLSDLQASFKLPAGFHLALLQASFELASSIPLSFLQAYLQLPSGLSLRSL